MISEKEKKNAKKIILDEEKEAEYILNSPTGEILYKRIFILGKLQKVFRLHSKEKYQ